MSSFNYKQHKRSIKKNIKASLFRSTSIKYKTPPKNILSSPERICLYSLLLKTTCCTGTANTDGLPRKCGLYFHNLENERKPESWKRVKQLILLLVTDGLCPWKTCAPARQPSWPKVLLAANQESLERQQSDATGTVTG